MSFLIRASGSHGNQVFKESLQTSWSLEYGERVAFRGGSSVLVRSGGEFRQLSGSVSRWPMTGARAASELRANTSTTARRTTSVCQLPGPISDRPQIRGQRDECAKRQHAYGITEDEPKEAAAHGAQREPNADLVRPPSDPVGQHTVLDLDDVA
jgi:hypothetical protein